MLHNASVFTDVLPRMIAMRPEITELASWFAPTPTMIGTRSFFIAYTESQTLSCRFLSFGSITVDVVDDIVALSRKACLDEFEVHPVTFQVLDLYRCKSPQTPLLLV